MTVQTADINILRGKQFLLIFKVFPETKSHAGTPAINPDMSMDTDPLLPAQSIQFAELVHIENGKNGSFEPYITLLQIGFELCRFRSAKQEDAHAVISGLASQADQFAHFPYSHHLDQSLLSELLPDPGSTVSVCIRLQDRAHSRARPKPAPDDPKVVLQPVHTDLGPCGFIYAFRSVFAHFFDILHKNSNPSRPDVQCIRGSGSFQYPVSEDFDPSRINTRYIQETRRSPHRHRSRLRQSYAYTRDPPLRAADPCNPSGS